jgi:RNA-directed DNA polymerase
MPTFANVIWGARCGKPARRVLLGETGSRDYAYSVRCRRESAPWRKAPHGLPSSRLVSTIRFDLWAERWRHRTARGNVIYVRYADDLVAGFEHEDDAQRFLAELRERLDQFALTLHPEKTRLIEFGRLAAVNRARRGLGKPETFDFLGFKHISGRSRSGYFQLKRKSRRDRMRAKLKALKLELRRRRHDPIPVQGRWLAQVIRGYFAYHAVPTNYLSLSAFLHHVKRLWLRTLRRRSQRDCTTWERVARLAAAFMPTPRILHPWPHARFVVNHPRWKPSA